jgi:hypothetical protein
VTIAVRSVREEWKQEVGGYIPAAFADPLLDWSEANDGRPVELTGTVEELTGHAPRRVTTWVATTLPTTGVRRVGRHGFRTRPDGLSSRRPPLQSRG